MRLNPPSIFVFLISLVLAALALVSKFGAIGIDVPRYLPHQEYWLAMIAYLAGITSTLGVLISAVNSQSRLIFNAGREGLLRTLEL